MLRRPKHPGTTLIRLYVLGAIFLIPLSIGIVLVTNNASQSDHAYKISHDVGSMYAQGVDFSQSANQNIALSVAEGIGIDIQGGKGVLILSKIRVVHPRTARRTRQNATTKDTPWSPSATCWETVRCAPAPSERPPVSIPPAAKFAIGPTTCRRAPPTSPPLLKPGEVTYAAECYLASPESPSGVYSRTMF